MKLIRKKPLIREYEDRWGRSLGVFYVDSYSGYVEDQFWDEIKEFEDYRYSDDNLKTQIHHPDFKIEDIQAPKMNRLLQRSQGQIWEFNLQVSSNSNQESEYLRTFAVFGKNTLREHRFSDRLLILYLSLICKWKNRNSVRNSNDR